MAKQTSHGIATEGLKNQLREKLLLWYVEHQEARRPIYLDDLIAYVSDMPGGQRIVAGLQAYNTNWKRFFWDLLEPLGMMRRRAQRPDGVQDWQFVFPLPEHLDMINEELERRASLKSGE